MSLHTLFIIALSLSFDAFGASAVRGAASPPNSLLGSTKVALFFGIFAFIGPVLGWLIGKAFYNEVRDIDHWIAFVLLAGVGAKMLHDGFGQPRDEPDALGYRALVLTTAAIATSIDSVAVGFGLPFLDVDIFLAASVIALVTAAASFGGIWVGVAGGRALGAKAEIAGGVILVVIGTKILIEHLSS